MLVLLDSPLVLRASRPSACLVTLLVQLVNPVADQSISKLVCLARPTFLSFGNKVRSATQRRWVVQ